MNQNKDAKSLAFWRGSEVSQEKVGSLLGFGVPYFNTFFS